MPVGSLTISVDLDPIRPICDAISVQDDITQDSVERWLRNSWEATSQNALVIDSVKLATELLAPKGTFVTKVRVKCRLNKYYHLANEHGHGSRAAWKLVQLDSMFGFLRSAVEKMPVGSVAINVDFDPIRPICDAISVQDDITQDSVERWLRNSWEATNQNALVIDSVKLATELLAPKGTFVTKVRGKCRLDKYYHLANEHGHGYRAAWKLVQLDSMFGFLRSAVEKIPVGSLEISVDLDPIQPICDAISGQDDITEDSVEHWLRNSW
ncbi:unnamed protein product [Fraxinus pennsylvanica]|uniref:Uncharacterized protein n=1 Tax=Fraxinus pennsylvanica TaxID=56036 RepID=A0AAD2E0N1_9LAMI|nr:unnamed protein product [Fraxinus pennsylvanica]